jgi:CDP-4-dehydro-6-deoxyglucose reductase, E3
MPIITLSSGCHFESLKGESIHDAATRADIRLPYSCKTGRCSACKCRVINGQSTVLHTEVGLTSHEQTEGWILSCVRSAHDDMVLEVDDLSNIEFPAIKTLPCKIDKLQLVAPDVIQVKLRLPPTADFKFIPGQYIELIGSNGIRRSYSIAKTDLDNKLIEIHIRAVEAGVMSEYLFMHAKVHDLLRLNGPLGTFILGEVVDSDLIFLATGTGIAPIIAMLESLKIRKPDQRPRSVTLLWGGRVLADLYCEISYIDYDFQYVPVLSRVDSSWTGARGYVQHELMSMQPDLSRSVVYACGSEAMISSAKELLLKNGLPSNRFYSDAFVCSSSK